MDCAQISICVRNVEDDQKVHNGCLGLKLISSFVCMRPVSGSSKGLSTARERCSSQLQVRPDDIRCQASRLRHEGRIGIRVDIGYFQA